MAEDVDLFGNKQIDEYDAFVEKFKPKKTTDDCYTPPAVYEAVANWVAEEYGVDRASFCRPFYPGGDYQAEDYTGKIVVDNPPFSILAEIRRYYNAHSVKYFLFAPALTLCSSNTEDTTFIACGCDIVYANGASVSTSFVTNLGDTGILMRSAPDLYRRVMEAVEASKTVKKQPKYIYPDCVISAAYAQKYSIYGVDWTLRREDCVRISALDAQRSYGKSIFGNGFLLNDRAAAERAAADRAAADRAAADRAAADRAAADRAAATVWELSERERDIVARLSGREPHTAQTSLFTEV